MSGLFGSITIKGNRLTEFAAQTATVGIPMPFGYGMFPCEGNVIFAALPPTEHVKKKKQGKGGVKTETYSYTLDYAVAFCEGPIFGYWTIKRNGKIVWTIDPNASVEDKAYAAKWAQKATFYYGTETQLPDPAMEAYKGVGLVSAHRGLAYISVEDDDVTDGGGAVPTYEAVIIASPPDVYLTSPPYAANALDGLTTQGAYQSALEWKPPIDNMTTSSSFVSGELPVVVGYKLYSVPPENIATSSSFVSGELPVVAGYKVYTAPPEDFITTASSFVSGELPVVAGYLVYDEGVPDNITTSSSFVSGTLS